jgi:hypothetical protein
MARRVFFAFHYKDVAEFRANAVRNHNIVKQEDAEYFDASLWEEEKKSGEAAVKRMVNGAVERTTVTAVLIGSETWARRWVRYEIMKSLNRGNLLLGIHINSIRGKDGLTKANGPNPFEYLGYRFSEDGRSVTLWEWNGREWGTYADLAGWDFGEAKPPQSRGQFYQLSKLARVYDWISDKGYENFNVWIGA